MDLPRITTAQLRAKMWRPDQVYHCGCCRSMLCKKHAEARAVEHYHPETTK